MSTYKELHGRSVVPASSNPATSGDAGKIFYNSTDNVFRSIVASEAWSASSPLSTLRAAGMAFGTQTATGYACGYTTTYTAVTEEYNGTGWSAGATGENAGTWGTKTNTNLEIIEQISGGYTTQAVTDGSDTALSVSDGSTGATLAHRVIEFTGSLTASRNVTIPLDVQNFYFFKKFNFWFSKRSI